MVLALSLLACLRTWEAGLSVVLEAMVVCP